MDFGRLITAMVTPFDAELNIAWEQVDRLVDYLIENGSEGIVVAGTTGESPTLTKEEKLKLFERVLARAKGRAKVIAGTGSNNTADSISLTQAAEKLGVDGVMLVAPYYNRPSQEGLYQHFKAIAEKTRLPIMIYNIPGRTGVNIQAETIIRLSQIPNITCVKEASGDLTQMARIIENTPDAFLLYSGDDKLLLPVLSIGGHGVVSVASHVIGKEMAQLIEAYLSGRVAEAARLHRKLLPVFEGLFFAPSPAPFKAALSFKGIDVGGLRPPLLPLNEEQTDWLRKLFAEFS